jgi:L-ascorbate metabolism protein UlaG (beta-lactamase superfamily)
MQAANLVRRLKPRIVLPMHYRSDEAKFGFDVIGTVSEFTENQDSVMTIPASEIETGYDLPAQIVIMRPANAEAEKN